MGEAFGTYAIWAAVLTFLTSVMAEFLIWTQVVSYWTADLGFPLKKATTIYAFIGLVGIFSMPIMGRIADKVVVMNAEVQANPGSDHRRLSVELALPSATASVSLPQPSTSMDAAR